MEEINKSQFNKKPLLKLSYTKDDVTSKFKFKEYSLDEISDLKIIKSQNVYIVLEGKMKDISVLLIKVRFFDKKSLSVFISTSTLFKVRSKYVLPKVGYIIDYNNGQFYTIYENNNGKLLEFDDFNNFNVTQQSDLVKLYLFNTIMKLVQNLKTVIKDKFKIGLLEPNLFVFNLHDQIPLKMIDFYFFNYFAISNSSKVLDFLRPVFGVYDIMKPKSNDMATMKIMLAKIFLDDDSFNYHSLISKYYLEFNIKKSITKKTQKNIMNTWTKEDENIFLFESIVKNIKNSKVKDFIINWEKEKIGYFGKDIKYDYDQFYEKAFLNVYNEIHKEYRCFGMNCNELSTKIFPFCFEPLCDNCFQTHRCNATIFQELNILYKIIPKLEDQIQKFYNELNNLMKINHLIVYSEYKQKISKIHNGTKRILQNTKKKILYYEHYINCIINYMECQFNKIMEIKFNDLDLLMNKFYEEKDEIYSKKLQAEIENCENFIKDTKNIFDNITKNLSIHKSIQNMYQDSEDYLKDMDIYYNNIFTFTFNEINDIIVNSMKNINFTKPILEHELIINNEKQSDIVFPILGTNKLVKFHEISSHEETVKFKESSFLLNFSKKFQEKIIPKGSSYVRIKNYIIFTGGFNDSNKTTLKKTGFIRLNSFKVKLRKGEMIIPRYNHSLLVYNDLFIIAIGGYDNNTVERYSIMRDKWSLIPNMNYKRENTSSIIIDNRVIYCFGGEHKGKSLDSIEYFDLNKGKRWKLFRYRQSSLNNENPFSGSSFGIIRIEQNNIYLIGGKILLEQDQNYQSSEYIYEIDLKNHFITLIEDRVKKGYFIENQLVDLGIENKRVQVNFDGENYNLISFKSFYSNI